MIDNINTIKKVREILYGSEYAVFFGGAGVSTASGIPDFRGTGGLYTGGDELSSEYYLSRACLIREPEKFYKFYRSKMLYPEAEPNGAHRALAELERRGIIKSVITQNIDGLHGKAGSRRVLELHGTTEKHYCNRCGKLHSQSYVAECGNVPYCSECGGVVRPDVTLYGEPLNSRIFGEAADDVGKADVLIVGGSSLTVYPAASLVADFEGAHLIIVNYSPTPYDSYAEFVIRDSIADVFGELL